jgi:hypothetical protein
MNKEVENIVNQIKINVGIAQVNGNPIIAEVSMNEKSKEYISNLIIEYGKKMYNLGIKNGIDGI